MGRLGQQVPGVSPERYMTPEQLRMLSPGLEPVQPREPRLENTVKLVVGLTFGAIGLYNAFRSRSGPCVVEGMTTTCPYAPDFTDTLASATALGAGAFFVADAFGVDMLG